MRTSKRIANGTAVFPVLMRWFLIALATASPAFACPTGADITNGVVLTRADGTKELYTNRPDNRTILDIAWPDGGRNQNTFIYGAFSERFLYIDDDGANIQDAWQIVYDTPPVPPEPGTSGTLQTRSGTLAGGLEPAVQTYKWGPLDQFTIGDCTYAAIEGVFSIKSDEFDEIETMMFLPDLGIGLLTAYQTVGYPADRTTYKSIAAR